jgi:hypothetical protein
MVFGGVALLAGLALAVTMIFSAVATAERKSHNNNVPDVSADPIPSESSSVDPKDESGIYPTSWGAAPFLPYQTVDETKTDEDVLAELKSRLRTDTFSATDQELLNVTKSFCYAYEKGESWSAASDHFITLGDEGGVDSNYADLTYNVMNMGYLGAHFYCPKYEKDIDAQLEKAQK